MKPKNPKCQKIGRRSSHKGAAFERLVSKKILAAAGPAYSKADFYRCPRSGAHEFVGEHDHIVSDRFEQIFPFATEAKHRKEFHLYQMLDLTANIVEYHQQALDAIAREKARAGKERPPLIILRSNGGALYCTSFVKALNEYHTYLADQPAIFYRYGDRLWKMMLFDRFLEAMTLRCQNTFDVKMKPGTASAVLTNAAGQATSGV